MNKSGLVDYISDITTLPKTDSNRVLSAVLDGIVIGLESEGKVNIIGFGSFVVVKKEERQGVHPKTGEPITIAEKMVIKFKPAERLKELVQCQ